MSEMPFEEIVESIEQIFKAEPTKIVISKPMTKSEKYKKIVVDKKNSFYQFSCYTDKQVFHINEGFETAAKRCEELVCGKYLQVNAWNNEAEIFLLISRKGKCMLKRKGNSAQSGDNASAKASTEHNRAKKYLLEEGNIIAPLVDMGIFTAEGKIVRTMYDKYRQINRFIEIIDDAIREKSFEELNIIDFGCGKSYLTFLVYYFLTEVRKIRTNIIGLDLKADVIEKCNRAAEKYGYSNLKFELGDINGYKCPFRVDMVMTLHACDTATDHALYNAIKWDASMIFSVPCCQHELNGQMMSDKLSILARYGIIKERVSSLMTDAIRGNLLEYSGYKTQLLEFVDLEHTPKNILIRAVKRTKASDGIRRKAIAEVRNLCKEFSFVPTLAKLLEVDLQDKEQAENKEN